MVVASGQYPYQYDFPLPLRGPVGQSGNIIEAGMFVLFSELRKFNQNPYFLDFVPQIYNNAINTPIGFEPNGSGTNLGGLVDGPAIVEIESILMLRNGLLDDGVDLFQSYVNETDYSFPRSAAESWLGTAYPESPSGKIINVETSPGNFQVVDATYLRPELTIFTGGQSITDADIHWLASSGIIYDIDVGEVIFQPFPFPSKFKAGFGASDDLTFSMGPFYPSFQKTDGSLISLTGREVQDASPGDWRDTVNFDAIGSGKLQLDCYAALSGTLVRLITGNHLNYFSSLSATSDFDFVIGGQRTLGGGSNPKNDSTSRIYWTPQAQSSGVYGIITSNPKSVFPGLAIESGIISIWPRNDARAKSTNPLNNDELGQSFTANGDDTVTTDPSDSRGFQVFDDAVWVTSKNAGLSGTVNHPSRGLYPISPHNGELMWYRPAELTVATAGTSPVVASEGPDVPTPGHFEVHVGMEPFGATEFVRLSRSYVNDNMIVGPTTTTQYDSTVYFEIYDKTDLTQREVSESWTITVPPAGPRTGALGNALGDLFYDGTSYYVVSALQSKIAKFSSLLVFEGLYGVSAGPFGTGGTGGRSAFINSEYLYWSRGDGAISVNDPLRDDPNMSSYNIGSGIGKFSFVSDPADITVDVGTFQYDSAKPIRMDNVRPINSTATSANTDIHDIIEIESADATHVRPGIWVLLTSDENLWLLRIEELSDHYRPLEAIRLVNGNIDDADYPYEIIRMDID
jgi:hypothetical protein